VRRQCPEAAVVGSDLLPVDPIEGVTILQMDFMDDVAPARLIEALGGAPDLIMSDMAANTVGHPQTDALRTMGLVEAAFEFAVENLAPGGTFVSKVFASGGDGKFVAQMKRSFASVKHAKPPSSRKGSVEWFVVAQGFKGRAADDDAGGE
jgi:23S rRNA (uridine2552-2'-O)-methyltransferase